MPRQPLSILWSEIQGFKRCHVSIIKTNTIICDDEVFNDFLLSLFSLSAFAAEGYGQSQG